MNRSQKVSKRAAAAKPQHKVKKATKQAAKRTIVSKPKKFPSKLTKTISIPSPITSPPLPIFQSTTRFFGAHAPVTPDKWGPQDPPYEGVQVEKFGKQALPPLFTTNTPSFKKNVHPLDFNGEIAAARPEYQSMTAEQLCTKFGIVLVDRDVAHCQGNVDGPHPQQTIQLRNTNPSKPSKCKYCGTRFVLRSAFDGSSIPFQPEH